VRKVNFLYFSNMKPVNSKPGGEPTKKSFVIAVFKAIKRKVSHYLEPEEVEITFEEGEKEHGSYTYTVVSSHKQVA
jgi:hypothetical protein